MQKNVKKHYWSFVLNSREKLPKYNIDTEYMFDTDQENCNHNVTTMEEYYEYKLRNGIENVTTEVRKHF